LCSSFICVEYFNTQIFIMIILNITWLSFYIQSLFYEFFRTLFVDRIGEYTGINKTLALVPVYHTRTLYIHIPIIDSIAEIILFSCFIILCSLFLFFVIWLYKLFSRTLFNYRQIFTNLCEYVGWCIVYTTIINCNHTSNSHNFISYTGAMLGMWLIFSILLTIISFLPYQYIDTLHIWLCVPLICQYMNCTCSSLLYLMWLEMGSLYLILLP
jgi:hypothetical protein